MCDGSGVSDMCGGSGVGVVITHCEVQPLQHEVVHAALLAAVLLLASTRTAPCQKAESEHHKVFSSLASHTIV